MQRLPFKIVACNSYDDPFLPTNLSIAHHQKSINKGWESARFCSYPQILVLQLLTNCRIKKLQLLVHHYKIPTKVEIHVAKTINIEPAPSMNQLLLNDNSDAEINPSMTERSKCENKKFNFSMLGYVILNDNAKLGYRARELKSVYLDAEGDYIKLILDRPYINQLNLYNQVALIAVNVLGQIRNAAYYAQSIPPTNALFDGDETLANPVSPASAAVWGLIQKTSIDQKIGVSDDLAFRLDHGKETIELVEAIQKAKHHAILDEDYLLAKSLKQALGLTAQTGKEITSLERDLHDAVAIEDYDRANSVRTRVDFLLSELQGKLETLGLEWTTDSHVRRKRTKPAIAIDDKPSTPIDSNAKLSVSAIEKLSPKPAKSPFQAWSPADASSASVMKPNDKVDGSIELDIKGKINENPPAIKSLSPLRDISTANSDDSLKKVEASNMVDRDNSLTEAQISEWKSCINVFGEDIVASFLSKESAAREQGLKHITKQVMDSIAKASRMNDSPEALLSAGYQISIKAFTFTSEKNLTLAIEFERSLQGLCSFSNLSHSMINGHLETIVPTLVNLTGHSSARIKQAAIDLLAELASNCPSIVHPILTQPFSIKKTPVPKLAIGRLELIGKLLDKYGFNNHGSLNSEAVMGMTGPLLTHGHVEVRECAVTVTAKVSVKGGKKAIVPYLTGLRPQQIQNIEDAITKEGGKQVKPKFKPVSLISKAMEDEATPSKVPADKIGELPNQLKGFRKIAAEPNGDADQSKSKLSKVESLANEDGHEEVPKKKRSLLLSFGKKSQASMDPSRETKIDKAVAAAAANNNKTETTKRLKTGGGASRKDENLYGNNDWNFDRKCIFCDEQNEKFTEENLDSHYLKDCLMLTICPLCKTTVEISSLSEHMFTECNRKNIVKKCARCGEAVLEATFASHVEGKQCKAHSKDKSMARCPLCHCDIKASDEAWKNHLLRDEGCPANIRTKKKSNHTPAIT